MANKFRFKESIESDEWKKFVKYITTNFPVEKENIWLTPTDKQGYDVEIVFDEQDTYDYARQINYSDFGKDYIFDLIDYSYGISLKIPAIRAEMIAENFKPIILKKEEDAIRIGDKNSDIKFWVDVWYDDGYPVWEYNQMSFSRANLHDRIMQELQQNESFYFIIDDVIEDNF